MKSDGLRTSARRALRGVSRLVLKAKIATSAERLHIRSEELGDLLIFQYNAGSARFYNATSGRVPIRLADSPHLQFAKAACASETLPGGSARSAYRDFLAASWPSLAKPPSRSIDEQIESFRGLTKLRQRDAGPTTPITVTRIPESDDLYIVDGNHRAAIALALGVGIAARLVPFELIFFRYLSPSEFYDTGHRGRPKQTIYYHQKPVIPGRRTDILQRLDLVPTHVLANASILDVGSNFGMNALAAAWRGGASVLGLERSIRLANEATRFAVLNRLYPKVTFRQFDVESDALAPEEEFDVCFMLSVFQHVRERDKLRQIAERHVRKWVVFEGHPGSSYCCYEPFFESGLFEDVAKLGELRHPLTRCRPLWLCTKKPEHRSQVERQ